MGKSKDNGYEYSIKEVLGVISPQEELKGDWVKAVLVSLMKQDGGEEETGIDVRYYNAGTNIGRKGIRMSIQEAHNACDILLQNGYGSIEVLEAELARRKNMFSSK